MTLRVLIVDDEPVARRGLRRLLSAHTDVKVIAECGDGESAIASIEDLKPDLVLLDVQMPELDGFGVVDAIGARRMPAVIFVTAFDHYALRAFDASAVDYVLKPVESERLARAIDRARERLNGPDETAADRIESLLQAMVRAGLKSYPSRLALRGDGRVRLVSVAEVDWIQAAGNYVELHQDKTVQLMRSSMADIATRLDPSRFFRISRSAIVQIDRVRELQPMFNGDFVVILKNGAKVAGSRRYRAVFDSLL
jgi:two-component system, LytTR family, response regulator